MPLLAGRWRRRWSPARTPVAVGRKRTSTVQLSPAASVADTTHVPPGTTTKSLGFTLEDAIPNRQNVKPPTPEFDSVTVTGALDIPSCTDPKSTLAGATAAVGPLAAPAVPTQAKAATAKSAATSLRYWWGHAADVVGGRSCGPHTAAPPLRVVYAVSDEGSAPAR